MESHTNTPLEDATHKLETQSGPAYWRSLEELASTDAFQEKIHNEFPRFAPAEADGFTRRNFLQVMGSTLALAGVTTGCARQPAEFIYPYVKQPEEIIPGKPQFFASAWIDHGFARPVLVESHMGRPTKVEGLPEHGAALGRTDLRTQASILDMYDPDRAKSVRRLGVVDSFDKFVAEGKQKIDDARISNGAGIRILTGAVTSPTLAGLIAGIQKDLPNVRWHQYEPADNINVREGARMAFGDDVEPLYHLDKADVVLALDSDHFDRGPGSVRYTADFAKRRDVVDYIQKPDDEHHGDEHTNGEHTDGANAEHTDNGASHDSPEDFVPKLNRLYAFESTPTNVGASADHRWPVRPSQIAAVATRIAAELGVSVRPSDEDGLSQEQIDAIAVVAADLKSHRGKAVVLVGDHQPAWVHALGHAINDALGAVGQTVTYIDSPLAKPVNPFEDLKALTDDMAAGKVDTLLIFDANPVYNAPADYGFLDALKNVKYRVQVSRYLDETGAHCHWHVPGLHDLETWGDARAFDGTVSLVQPLIAPLYDGHSPLEVLSALFEEERRTAHDIVQAHWKNARGENGFDTFWKQSLSDGYVANTAYRPRRARLRNAFLSRGPAPVLLGEDEFEVAILPDHAIGDGSQTNNAWLMEVPRPLTKITWENAVIFGYSTAKELGLENEDVVEVSIGDYKVQGPVWVQPGHANNTITLTLGFGRTRSGKVSEGMGYDAYAVMTADAPATGATAKITKQSNKHSLARTEQHWNMEGRDLVRHVPEGTLAAHPSIVKYGPDHHRHVPTRDETLLDPDEKVWDGYAWGMTIDLNKCTGCNACVIACQSENVIPVVGKTEVMNGREMQWIRVDRYYQAGDAADFRALPEAEQRRQLDNPKTYYQPVPCMQCENAPCEIVCPVGATQHSKEGLNDMVYNRCIGTRYCSNNCPYKVRRFNFYNYSRTPLGSRGDRVNPLAFDKTHVHPESLKPLRNPDVTVRGRGVMEKCTYCVQRINTARIEAKKNGNAPIGDGDCVTACQQACPAGAIDFGDINNPETKVAKRKKSVRNYGLLDELNTVPRTTYLARVTNPNPELDHGDHEEQHA